MANLPLKQIKERATAVNATLLEMEFSELEILDFWQDCLKEVDPDNKTNFKKIQLCKQ
ncbi:MAG: hypothetical protein JJE55_08135 [Flavobacteriaceae bacterium]|nr:hypothetical protein [Flavobacteriaceae bacterium]